MNTECPQQASEKKISLKYNSLFTPMALVVMGIGTGLVSLLIGASVFGLPMFFSYFSSPLLILFNLLPPVLFTLFFYYATGRAWLGFLVPAVPILLLSVVSYFKMQVRAEPLYFSDYQLADEALKTVGGYELIVNWKVWFAALYTVGGTVAAFLFLKHRPRTETRLIGAAAAAVAMMAIYTFVYTDEKLYESVKGSYDINPFSNAENYIVRGFVYPFIGNIGAQAMEKPDDYKEFDAAQALAAHESDVIPVGEKVNIVSVMLESYADLSVYESIDFELDVYGPLHALEREALHGSLVNNIFAGGTINTERSFLTGYTTLDDFLAPENSYVYYLKEQGYHVEGFHAGDSWFYDRKTVNARMGFDTYYFLEDFENSDRWDGFFFSKILELYENRDPAVPYFSYNLSYQNHGPYDSEVTTDTAYLKKDGLSDKTYAILNNYLEGVNTTTQHITQLIDYFRDRREPVVVVLFGDHKPWLGDGNSVFHELGINIDLSTAEGFYNFYTTPYIIWANEAAKAVLSSEFMGNGGDFSPCFLMNRLFEECAWGGNAYMKAANELFEHVPVVNSATGYFVEDGVVTTRLSPENDQTYEDFLKIEYYWKHNFDK